MHGIAIVRITYNASNPHHLALQMAHDPHRIGMVFEGRMRLRAAFVYP